MTLRWGRILGWALTTLFAVLTIGELTTVRRTLHAVGDYAAQDFTFGVALSITFGAAALLLSPPVFTRLPLVRTAPGRIIVAVIGVGLALAFGVVVSEPILHRFATAGQS